MTTARSALIVLDMINTMAFEGGAPLLKQAVPAARRLAALKRRAHSQRVPVIYANDNFTQWRHDFHELVAICSQPECDGAPLAKLLAPGAEDYAILKPKHSGFLDSPLEILLKHLKIDRLLIGGIAGDGCVLATVADAHMHEFEVTVASDCVASITKSRNERALAIMRDAMDAHVCKSSSIRF